MTHSILGYNIKHLRLEQQMTQQMLAERLAISPQSVSKWETGLSLPDVSLLPEIASCFGVTIDLLFQPHSSAYRNKAARRLAQYTLRPGDWPLFLQADQEYRLQLQSTPQSAPDLADYGFLQEHRARELLKAAEACYQKAMDCSNGETEFYKTQRQWIRLLSYLGRGEEAIQACETQFRAKPAEPMAHVSLLAAYQETGRWSEAGSILEKALTCFPQNAMILMYAGAQYQQQGEFDRAEACWQQAWAADPEMIDALYALADLYQEEKREQEAQAMLERISAWNSENGHL